MENKNIVSYRMFARAAGVSVSTVSSYVKMGILTKYDRKVVGLDMSEIPLLKNAIKRKRKLSTPLSH